MNKVFQQKLGTKINSSKAGYPFNINFLSLASVPCYGPVLVTKKKKKKKVVYN